MSKVLINDLCLRRPATGVVVYLRNILAAWPKEAVVRPAPFLSNRGLAQQATLNTGLLPAKLSLRPLNQLRPPVKALNRLPHCFRSVGRSIYSRLLAKAFDAGNYAAYFEPNHLAMPVGRPTVTTIHDLSILEQPAWHPADRVAQWQANLKVSQAVTDHWIAVSHFTAARMQAILGIDPERITVIHSAGRPLAYPKPDDLPGLLAAMGLPPRYLLHLGTIEPRKNIPILLDAMAQLSPAARASCPLVLAGRSGWGDETFWRSLIEHPQASETLWAGFVDDAAAAVLLAGASSVLVPSFYEGFGLPILEAMNAGSPVICSTAEAFREVAGAAGRFVEPADSAGWADAMRQAVEDESWRIAQADRGKTRAGEFSWNSCATAHAAVLERITQRHPLLT